MCQYLELVSGSFWEEHGLEIVPVPFSYRVTCLGTKKEIKSIWENVIQMFVFEKLLEMHDGLQQRNYN